MAIRRTLLATIYSVALGLGGLGFLVAVTPLPDLLANAAPLAIFAALSFILKRTGLHIAPQVTHSLVGIVDLAVVLIFGPVLGAWVAASSGFLYLFLTAWRRDRHTLPNLFETPIFNAGLKVGMAYGSSHVYTLLGGHFAPRALTPETLPAALAAIVAWFTIDHLGWGVIEYLRGGPAAFVQFLRSILFSSLVIELLPLPFSIVIAVAYSSLDRGTFAILALGVLGTAVVVQRYADTSSHLERRRNDLAVLTEFGQALSLAGFDVDRITDLLCTHAQRIVPVDLCRIEYLDRDHASEPNTRLALEMIGDETRHPNTCAPASPLWTYYSGSGIHRAPIRALDLPKAFVDPLEGTGPAVAVGDKIRIDGRPPRSALFVPMVAGDDLIGILSLFAVRPRAFFPLYARNLASMASHAAVAVQNARLYAVERKRATELAIVSEVSRQVAQVLDIDELLQAVVNGIRERFGYSKVHIFTVDAGAGYAVFRASTDPRSAHWREKGWRLRLGLEGIIGWVAAVGEPLVVADVRQEPRFILEPDETESETRSELAAPLVVGKEIVGVLDVQDNRVNIFGADDLYIMNTLAAQVAIAIEDARLFNSQKEEAWYLNVMLQVAENLSHTASLEEALETVVRITPLLVGVARCAILMYDAAAETFVPAKAYGLSDAQNSALLQMRFRADDYRALSRLRREQAPVVVDDPLAVDMIRAEIREVFGIHAMLLAPLMTRGEMVGAMFVDQGARPGRFTAREIQVVMGIANQAAVAIESARLNSEAEGQKRFEYELGLARQIQQSFLPEACPVLPGYEICSMWQTAREVGGDFYDFIPLTGGRWGIVIADVSDKGMAAALFMALSRTIIRTMAIGKPTPHEALDRANDVILTDAHSDMFVTVFFAVLDPARAAATFVNAGHNPPLLYRAATRQVETLREHGIALGVIPNISLHDSEVELAPGDVLLLYTDGVTEAMNEREEEFGAERLASLLADGGHLTASALIDEITHEVEQFTGGGPNSDDLTMVIVKRLAAE